MWENKQPQDDFILPLNNLGQFFHVVVSHLLLLRVDVMTMWRKKVDEPMRANTSIKSSTRNTEGQHLPPISNSSKVDKNWPMIFTAAHLDENWL
jgi:hypothetical protein